MAQNDIRSDTPSSYFIQKHSVPIRIWHWLFFFLLSASIITILVVTTLFKPQSNGGLPQGQPNNNPSAITQAQPNPVAREAQPGTNNPAGAPGPAANPVRVYRERLFTLHTYIGYGIAFLLFSRIVIEITESGNEKVLSRFKKAINLFRQNDKNKADYRHYIAVKIIYLLFYISITVMALTGLGLALGGKLQFLRPFRRTLGSVHSFVQYIIYAFVFLHLCSVVIADIRNARGIVSGMIHGNI
jgi:Ni/Fe-hydrogenase 1 B-type cytochrome subunit